MRKIAILLVVLLLCQSVLAISVSDARQEWVDAKETTKEKREVHQEAKLKFAGDKTDENRQTVVDTGKEVLHAGLDEAEAWLKWKEAEIAENTRVPDELLDQMNTDIETNLAKIEDLRNDVDNVKTQLELGVTWLKMVGKHAELLADVARDSGKVWVYIGNVHADKIEEFEGKLREAAGDDQEVLAKLDSAKAELESARENIEKAASTYEEVKIPGKPLIKFGEANRNLRAARANLIGAHRFLNQAYRELVR